MKKSIIITFLAILPLLTLPQGAQDVLKYSRQQTWGTARYMSAGGAFGSLGADFTLASVNPAGIGFYKTSEIIFTPAVHWQNTQSIYNGFSASDSRTNFYLGNIGIVIASGERGNSRQKGWKNFQFATGLNRIKDFNSRMIINGPNPENSLLDTYRDYAQGPPQIPYEEIEEDVNYYYADDLNLAWWTFLLDVTDSVNYDYKTPIPYAGIFQTKEVETKGSINEYVLTGSANYNNKLYLGLTLGIPFVRYFETSKYYEEDNADTIFDFMSFSREDHLETRGTGINIKFGAVYRITEWVRIGAAVHTPTWYSGMKDNWYSSMESHFDNGESYSKTSPEGEYKYKINTPFRAIGSMSFIFGEKGFVSLDYEYTDYSTGKIKSSYSDHEQDNADVKSSYSKVHQIRAGTEWRHKNFGFRAGYSFAGSPYQANINSGGETTRYSAGMGYRKMPIFIDFAYVHQRTRQDYYLYLEPSVESNPSDNLYLSNHFILSVGYRF